MIELVLQPQQSCLVHSSHSRAVWVKEEVAAIFSICINFNSYVNTIPGIVADSESPTGAPCQTSLLACHHCMLALRSPQTALQPWQIPKGVYFLEALATLSDFSTSLMTPTATV